MNVTKEQKLEILDRAIEILKNYSYSGMCAALYSANVEILKKDHLCHRQIFLKFTRFNYFLRNLRWSVIREYITCTGFWDTADWYYDEEGTLKAQERRIKFLEYLKTTV